MEPNEESVQTLLAMGFPHEGEIRRALKMARNDINEALSILTNESPTITYDTLDDLDVEMKDSSTQSTNTNTPGTSLLTENYDPPEYGPHLPTYDEVVQKEQAMESSSHEQPTKPPGEDESELAFPVANLIELEGRVFTESWSIPYRKEESLGKCLVAATRLANEGLAENDQQCKRFLEKCMPESFQKLMTSGAVHRWGPDIQEGVYDMLQLLMDLVATSLKHDPVPVDMLFLLATVFNPVNEYHIKNKIKRPDRAHFEEKFGSSDKFYALSPAANSYKDPYGWLTNLINSFGEKGGIVRIQEILERKDLDAVSLSALLGVFGHCAEFLNEKVMKPLLSNGMENAVDYVRDLTDNDLKNKKVIYVCDMLAAMKLICIHMWPTGEKRIDDLRLDFVIRMLKAPHFNARMNALKEVTKWIEENSGTKMPKYAISKEQILDWLVDNRVLSITLEGNIHQMQYCEKIKTIVDFLGHRLSLDELTKIWKMQNGETNAVIDNIHSIIAAAGVRFNTQQLEHLVIIVQKSWEVENDKMREKLLSLIGKIGRETTMRETTTRILELLWDLAHLPALPTHLIEQALDEHLAILTDSYIVKESVKKHYITKCVDDIKEGKWVLPALKQLLQIAKNFAKNSFHKAEKGILQELNQKYEIIKQVTHSLRKFHELATQQASQSAGIAPTVSGREAKLAPETSVDGRYTHKDYVTVHLSFLQFVLQEGALYLPWSRARDIWDTLAASHHACVWDMETCFEWFTNGIADLEADTQAQLFQKELLRLDASCLSDKGFSCFKCFFENVNQSEHKLKRTSMSVTIEKTDLIGVDYLWEICLNTPDPALADQAIQMLMSVSYSNLTPRLKRDPLVLHKKFIQECYKRLESAMVPLGGSAIAQALHNATKVLAGFSVPEASNSWVSPKSTNLVNIERLLLIAERYITSVEELYTAQRTIQPHGASFQGQPLSLYIVCETPKNELTLKAHTNEMIGSIRQKIAAKFKSSPEQIQIMANDKMLSKDQKLLHQLDIEDQHLLSIRVFSSAGGGASGSSTFFSGQDSTPGTPKKESFDLEQEKMLPGVVMASGGQVFEMLYHLADLDEPRITTQARSLLKLIPTDPAVQEMLEGLGGKASRQPPPEEASPRMSPRSSPRKILTGSSSSLSSLTSSPGAARPDPRDTLRAMYDATAPGMTTFRVLYNLEVLSSQLMPTQRDGVTIQSSKTFCEDFLDAGGLGLVVNVLQKDAVPSDVDYETRQGCYAIALQLLRYLLCGQDHIAESISPDAAPRRHSGGSSHPGGAPLSSSQPGGGSLTGAGAGMSLGPSSLGSGSGPPSLEVTPAAACKAIQTMGVYDFTETVACFMRVTWAAAAGKLHLASSSQPIKESMANSILSSTSSRSSTGSSGSTGSESDTGCLHPGLCIRQTTVSTRDANIAKEALELLVTCLLLRSQLLASFYSLPCVGDFIIDVLVGSPHHEIRTVALGQFYQLSLTEMPVETLGAGTGALGQPSPHHFMLQILLKARLPFWVSSSSTRGASFRLLKQCSQYFELRCRLLSMLSAPDQHRLQISIPDMLEDEVGWLHNFMPSENPEVVDTDSMLIAGHLRLIKTLLTCHGVDKCDVGKQIIEELLHDFLFPASKMIQDNCDSDRLNSSSMQNFTPKCSDSASRIAAYDLLVELADSCLTNQKIITTELTNIHHTPNPELATQWEYMPPVDGRSRSGFVGLKNGGATCYMNSVLQQLYMSQGIPESILSSTEEEVDEESILHQVQQIFGHLLESRLQYYVPERFWKVFRLWGQTVNIREQQDALDFYQAIIDQCDEQVKKIGKDPIFKKTFQGIYSDQKICQGCPHRYEREEVFFALNVTVKNATLQDSLDQFVKGELLEGDNAYFCEKCGEKRNTIKRMCIKNLPPVLCIQLKRFDYDWEANRALKFDDFFKFPWVLDMEPYTAEGMALRDEDPPGDPGTSDSDTSSYEAPGQTPGGPAGDEGIVINVAVPTNAPQSQINYELVGVVVHSGQANAGHYYSFIKDRRGTYLSNPHKGRWYKFNDTSVEEFDMTDSSLEEECFGGKYKAKVYNQGTSSTAYPEERIRYWNGYLLFYERMEEVRTPLSAKKSKVTMKRGHPEIINSSKRINSLVELTELVHKGEKKGLFTEKMPARIQQMVREENLRFMKNHDVYDLDYFCFMRRLVKANMHHDHLDTFTDMSIVSLQTSVRFLFNTYLRTKSKLRHDLDDWVYVIGCILLHCRDACMWLTEFFSFEGRSYLRPFLLESPSKEIRAAMGKILEKLMTNFVHHKGVCTHKCFNEILETLLCMLQKDVPDNCKNSVQYFTVFSAYVQLGIKACSHMNLRQGFQRLMCFLLGTTATTSSDQSGHQEQSSRRWSSVQARDFGPLHATLAMMILNCDVAAYRTEEPGKHPEVRPATVTVQRYLKMSAEMHSFVFGIDAAKYIREIVLALREVNAGLEYIEDMLLHCCFCNEAFSTTLLRNVVMQYTNAPSNELKGILQVLHQILVMEDGLQLKRLQLVIDGFEDEQSNTQYDGMLAVIKSNHQNDSRRSYQCIKFLVQLANKCALAKDYLLQNSVRWQWAVNWLKKKMTEYYWSPSVAAVTSNEDSSSKSFQRTISAQDTLAEATALLTELESLEPSDMETAPSPGDGGDTQVLPGDSQDPPPPPSGGSGDSGVQTDGQTTDASTVDDSQTTSEPSEKTTDSQGVDELDTSV